MKQASGSDTRPELMGQGSCQPCRRRSEVAASTVGFLTLTRDGGAGRGIKYVLEGN